MKTLETTIRFVERTFTNEKEKKEIKYLQAQVLLLGSWVNVKGVYKTDTALLKAVAHSIVDEESK